MSPAIDLGHLRELEPSPDHPRLGLAITALEVTAAIAGGLHAVAQLFTRRRRART